MTTESEKLPELELSLNFGFQRKKALELKIEPLIRRKERLVKLRDWILFNRFLIHEAMFADFAKHATEVDAIELFPVLSEIKHALKNLQSWIAPKETVTPLTMLGTRSYILCEPRGVCLIIAPWNYPFLLCAGPLVSALAAGNAVTLKPSEVTPHVSAVIKRMAAEVFEPSVVSCYEGGVEMSQQLLKLPFDHVFFTGSPTVGKIIMKAAAENLTSVTLELGGKSPAIITRDANIEDAAVRTAVAKFVNNGQTCLAPDYILVHESIAEDYIERLIATTEKMFKERDKPFNESSHYCRIVNDHHYQRLDQLLDDAVAAGAKVRFGGTNDRGSRFMHPTVLADVPAASRIMREEIFGPLLPVITFNKLEEAIALVNDQPKPLALYIFSQNDETQKRILNETTSGGACINDCGTHFFQYNLPFGGVNNSGIGKSHGYYGFLDFSNQKAVLKQKKGMTSVKMLYPPYTNRSRQILDWIFRFFSR